MGLFDVIGQVAARQRHIFASRMDTGATITDRPREGFLSTVAKTFGIYRDKKVKRQAAAVARDARIINQIDYSPGYVMQGDDAGIATPPDPSNSVFGKRENLL